jgi:hypothetical protein
MLTRGQRNHRRMKRGNLYADSRTLVAARRLSANANGGKIINRITLRRDDSPSSETHSLRMDSIANDLLVNIWTSMNDHTSVKQLAARNYKDSHILEDFCGISVRYTRCMEVQKSLCTVHFPTVREIREQDSHGKKIEMSISEESTGEPRMASTFSDRSETAIPWKRLILTLENLC